jgi:hypothetical protein
MHVLEVDGDGIEDVCLSRGHTYSDAMFEAGQGTQLCSMT